MYINLNIFLKFLGFEPLCKNKVYNVLYYLFIFTVLTYYPVLLFVTYLSERESIFLSRSLLNFIQQTQFIIGFFYFRNQRTKRLYESKNLDFLDESQDGVWKYLPKEKQLLKLVFTISIIFIIESITVFFIAVEETETYYKNYSIGIQILNYILIPLSIIYGRFILTLNTHIFFFSFLQQIKKMQNLRKKLLQKEWKEGRNISVASLCYDIIDMKYTLKRMIKKLQNMYSYTTLLGAISIGIIIASKKWDFQAVTGGFMFVIMQVFFLMIIQMIDSEKEGFSDIIEHRDFASKYILRRNEFCQACINIQVEDNILENSFVPSGIMSSVSESDVKFEKKILPLEKFETLEEFKETQDSLEESGDVRQRIQTMLGLNGMSDPHILADSGCTLTTEELIRCIYEWVSNTGSSIDWIILDNILSKNWTSFGMFGIEFSDGSAFKKAVGTTIALALAGSFFNIANFNN